MHTKPNEQLFPKQVMIQLPLVIAKLKHYYFEPSFEVISQR